MGKGSGTTIGYRYKMSLQMGLCRGPVDEIVEIRVDELRAWPKFSTDYDTNITTKETYADLQKSLFFDPGGTLAGFFNTGGTLAEVTTDPNPALNGFYRRDGAQWVRIAPTLNSPPILDSQITYIDSPKLFGGDDKEGGIQGSLTVMMGEITQVTNDTIKGLIGGIVPGFRGVASLFFDGLVCSMNPYPKTWKVRVRRAVKGWYNDTPWYPEKAMIQLTGFTNDQYLIGQINAMNPAHIIFQCVTDPQWGKGLDWIDINISSFRLAADQLYKESFGLCMMWLRQDDIDVFVQSIVDTIGGVVYVDRATGLLTLKLFRADYDPSSLPIWGTENGLLSIEDDDSSAQSASYNEVIVSFTEAVTGKPASVRAQNLASYQATGQINSTTAQYPSIPTKELAARVAVRDVGLQSVGLKSFKVMLDRRGWKIAPGSVFRVKDPKRDIGTIVLRAAHVDDGTDTGGAITVSAVQDVFGLPDTSYVVTQPSTWTPIDNATNPPTAYKFIELPYRDLVRKLSPADLAAVTLDEGFVASIVGRPTGNATSYFLQTKATGDDDYADRSSGDFAASALLNGATGPYDTTVVVDNLQGWDADDIGYAFMVDDEIMGVVSFDPDTSTLTVTRGAADTLPAAHADNTRGWLYENEFVEDTRSYVNSEVISGRFITGNSYGRADPNVAPVASVTVGLRQACPYPPGQVRMNDGTTLYKVYSLTSLDIFTGDFDIEWVGRDRIVEADTLIDESAANVGPESGVTYTMRVYNGGTLLRTDAAATSPWTYDSVMAAADGDPRHPRFELVSVRDSLESFYKHSFVINRDATEGYGEGWDKSWGEI